MGDIVISFDEVAFTVSQLNGYGIRIRAMGYVSFRIDGVWSDMHIADADLLDSGKAIESAEAFAASQPERDSGNRLRDIGRYRLLRINLESGGLLECVSPQFEAEPADRRFVSGDIPGR